MKYCTYCGFQLKDDMRFCPECGKKAAFQSDNLTLGKNRWRKQRKKPRDGLLLFFLQNQVLIVYCMRLLRPVEEKLFLRAEDIGVVAKKHLKNGKQRIEYGLVKTAMAHHEKRHFLVKFKTDSDRTRFSFMKKLGIIRKRSKKQKHCLMVLAFLTDRNL